MIFMRRYAPDILPQGEHAKNEFNFSLHFIRSALAEKSPEESRTIIQYLMNIVRNDLKYSLLANVIYSREHGTVNFRGTFFPFEYPDERGQMKHLPCTEEPIRRVDFAQDFVIVVPWDIKRLARAITYFINNTFTYIWQSHTGYYYTNVDFAYIGTGRHSSSVGSVMKKGIVYVKEVDITPLFDCIYTDGIDWYSTFTGKRISTLLDFRVGVLFELAKKLHQLTG